nr:galactinol synthase 1 [Quercus suber]
MVQSITHRYAYATLITRASYLAGVIVLAHSLQKHGSRYPLIVFFTPTLVASALHALELESKRSNLILQPCTPLLPRAEAQGTLIAERFGDTWTKLRVFDLPSEQYTAVCYLDADMAIFNRNMDAIFNNLDRLPPMGIAANHACVCNLDHDSWAPSDWTPENCAYTPLVHPFALDHPTQPTNESRPTYHLLNSGMFLYRPSVELWDRMLHFFNTSDRLREYKFPDQDFLADFFHNNWLGLGWQWNAIKTMRYWHPAIWRDDEVVCLHYIVDKPWASRIGADGVAGYKGDDGETHAWWWKEFAAWEAARNDDGEVRALVQMHVAREDGGRHDDKDMEAIGSRVQAYANNADSNIDRPNELPK